MDKVRRSVAIGLVNAEKNGYSNLLLGGVLQGAGADERSRAFAAYLFYGVLERQYTLDALLAPYLKKPLKKLDPEVRAVLRSGLYQALYMDSVPQRAAVNESVELCRDMGKGSAAGMVNAVLRRAVQAGLPDRFASEEERLSVLYSVHPAIAALLLQQYGTETEEILAASFERPAFAVRVNTLKTDSEALMRRLAQEGVQARPGRLDDCLLLENVGSVSELASFREGLFHVQGEASQCVVRLLCPAPGHKAVDLCCAPGGKSATLAQLMEDQGALYCRDASPGRLTLAQTLLERLGVSIASFSVGEGQQFAPAFTDADAVLCDVPCSGLGTMAKKPDIRQKDLSDIDALCAVQHGILHTAAAYPRVGGHLVYSTCTINRAENQDVVRAFLKEHENYRMVSAILPFPGAIHGDFGTLLLPNRAGTDGFFMACLERLW